MLLKHFVKVVQEVYCKLLYNALILIDQAISCFPGKTGWKLRKFAYANRIVMGKNVMIDEHVCIKYPERMKIGNNSFIGRGTMIQSSGNVDIGSDVIIGPFVKIWSSDHVIENLEVPIHKQGHIFGKVVIEDDVWIGTGAIVLKGIVIRRGAVVAAGSVVTKDVCKYAVMAGNPARVIRYRNDVKEKIDS